MVHAIGLIFTDLLDCRVIGRAFLAVQKLEQIHRKFSRAVGRHYQSADDHALNWTGRSYVVYACAFKTHPHHSPVGEKATASVCEHVGRV